MNMKVEHYIFERVFEMEINELEVKLKSRLKISIENLSSAIVPEAK